MSDTIAKLREMHEQGLIWSFSCGLSADKVAAASNAWVALLEVAEAASELCVFCSNDNLWRTKNALEALGKLELP